MWRNIMNIIQRNDEADDYLNVSHFWQRSWWRFVFADVYLSFYILSDVVVCLNTLVKMFVCRTKKRCLGIWVPFVSAEKSEQAYSQFWS